MSTINDTISLQFNNFLFKFDSPQVKQNLVLIIINYAYDLYHELSNDTRIRILGN